MSPTLGVTAADASRPVVDANAASDAEQHKHRCAAIRTPDAVYLALTAQAWSWLKWRVSSRVLGPYCRAGRTAPTLWLTVVCAFAPQRLASSMLVCSFSLAFCNSSLIAARVEAAEALVTLLRSRLRRRDRKQALQDGVVAERLAVGHIALGPGLDPGERQPIAHGINRRRVGRLRCTHGNGAADAIGGRGQHAALRLAAAAIDRIDSWATLPVDGRRDGPRASLAETTTVVRSCRQRIQPTFCPHACACSSAQCKLVGILLPLPMMVRRSMQCWCEW